MAQAARRMLLRIPGYRLAPPLSLALGAASGALFWLEPWALLLGLAPIFLRGPSRVGFSIAFLALLIRGPAIPQELEPFLGQEVVLSGQSLRGFLSTAHGKVYLSEFPPPEDGHLVVRGVLRRPEAARNPGGFPEDRWLLGQGVGQVLEVEEVIRSEQNRPAWEARFRSGIGAGLSPEAKALAEALVVGERQNLTSEEDFRAAGLAHVLALSALNVGVLSGILYLAFSPLGRARYFLPLPLLALYLSVAGPLPSLVRAVAMGGMILVILGMGRGRISLLTAWSWALALHLLAAPYAIVDLGFLLSYLAILGMALVLPRLSQPRGWSGWLVASAATTVSAQVLLVPLILDEFHQLPVVGTIANLIGVPLVTTLVPIGFLNGALGVMGISNDWVSGSFEAVAQILLVWVGLFANSPQVAWGDINPIGYLLYYLAVFPLVLALYQKLAWPWAVGATATCAGLGLAIAQPSPAAVWQFDVGQGDATLIQASGGVEVLFDAGREYGGPRIVQALRALGVDDLDLLVGTHGDLDHLGGFPAILKSFPVGAVVLGPADPSDPLEARIRAIANLRGVPVLEASAGTELEVGDIKIQFLHPPSFTRAISNERSLVGLVEYQGHTLLVTGDLPTSELVQLPALDIDILKVSHHGAKNGTKAELIEQFKPEVALIGVGTNPYGHPSPETLKILQSAGVEVRRTDLEGAIQIPLP